MSFCHTNLKTPTQLELHFSQTFGPKNFKPKCLECHGIQQKHCSHPIPRFLLERVASKGLIVISYYFFVYIKKRLSQSKTLSILRNLIWYRSDAFMYHEISPPVPPSQASSSTYSFSFLPFISNLIWIQIKKNSYC